MGYNALGGGNLYADNIWYTSSWIDSSEATIYKIDNGAVLEQRSHSFYTKSSLELMTKLGLDYSNTTSANFAIGKAKAGIENKFSVNFDYTNTQTTEELFLL